MPQNHVTMEPSYHFTHKMKITQLIMTFRLQFASYQNGSTFPNFLSFPGDTKESWSINLNDQAHQEMKLCMIFKTVGKVTQVNVYFHGKIYFNYDLFWLVIFNL